MYISVGVVILSLSLMILFRNSVQGREFRQRPRSRPQGPREIGYFWQLSDIFFDPSYSLSGAPENGCHIKNAGNFSRNCGFFGEFEQCSAFGLVETLARMMFRRIKHKSDFYLFTGNIRCPSADQTPHAIYETMRAFLKDMREAGPNVSIYPSYGWYDYHPYGHHPMKFTTFYGEMSEVLRDQWETTSLLQSRWLMGYFSRVQLPKRRLRVIVLNTNYYMRKHIASQLADPAGQWAWLLEQFRSCRMTGQKAYIVMSIPPGIHERSFRSSDSLMWAQRHNRRYVKIVREYKDVIAAQFAGDHRTDTFRLVYSKREAIISAVLLAPSVEPRNSNLPSIRAYMYDINTGEVKHNIHVLDYVQYYFNLTKANLDADMLNPEKYWQFGYSFRDFYGLPDVSLQSLETLVARMQKDNASFQRYFKATRSLREDIAPCEERCKIFSLCAITNLDLSRFFECISGKNSTIEEADESSGVTRDYLLRQRAAHGNGISVLAAASTIELFASSMSAFLMSRFCI